MFSLPAQRNVPIVGGGMAGVATAHFILKSDPSAKVTIFEKNKILGGNAHTISTINPNGDTLFVDAGPQYFADESWDTYIELLKEFDFVVMATHPYQAAKILRNEATFQTLIPTLNKFEYFEAHIVLHRYNGLVDPKYPSFFNSIIDDQTNMISNTMDLGQVDGLKL